MSTCLLLLAAASGPASAVAPAAEDHWPAWRGPHNTGVAAGAAPVRWSDEENVAWRAEIPGRGFSTPVVWGERVFLTTAVPLEEAPEPEPEAEGGGRGRRATPLVRTAFLVLCLDRGTGEVLWERAVREATPHEGYHDQYGSHASISPVTDGERLIASFGSFGIYCFDLDGELLWEKDLGVQMRMRNAFGEGSAPALHGDTLLHVFDHEGDSFLVALDAETGEERWRVARDEPSTWGQPLVTEVGGRWQVITTGTNRVRAYALDGGKLVWECGGLGLNAIPSLLRHGDLLLAMTGYRENNLMAIRLGREGDLTGSDAVVWSTKRGNPYTASPVLHEGLLYTVTDRGQISCWDAATGEPNYVEERLPRGTSLKASPVAAGEHLYVPDEEGRVHVLRLGPELELVATNALPDEFFVASPVVVGGQLLLRGRQALYCIAERADWNARAPEPCSDSGASPRAAARPPRRAAP